METVRVGEVDLVYEVWGHGSTVWLVHGLSLDHRMWLPLIPALEDNHRVYAHDQRGHGRSGAPETGYSVRDYSADLIGLWDALGLDRVHLVGLSLGGAVAAHTALEHPERVRSLSLIDAYVAGHSVRGDLSANPWTQAGAEGLEAAKQAWLNCNLFAPAMRQPRVAAALREMVELFSGRPWLAPPAQPEPDDISRIGELQLPVLVMYGGRDLPAFQDCARLVQQRVPRHHHALIAQAGHLPPMEAPGLVNGALVGFLAAADEQA